MSEMASSSGGILQLLAECSSEDKKTNTFWELRAKEKEALLKLSLQERVRNALRETVRQPWRVFSVLVTSRRGHSVSFLDWYLQTPKWVHWAYRIPADVVSSLR